MNILCMTGRCANLVTVDLNSLLYKIEADIEQTIREEFGGRLTLTNGTVEKAGTWKERAEKRVDLINKYLWNQSAGMFF